MQELGAAFLHNTEGGGDTTCCRGKCQLNPASRCGTEKVQELHCRKPGQAKGIEVIIKHVHSGDTRLKQITCADLSRVSPSRHFSAVRREAVQGRTKHRLSHAKRAVLTATTKLQAGVGTEQGQRTTFWGLCLPWLILRDLCFGHHIASIIFAYDITSVEEAAYSWAVASSHQIQLQTWLRKQAFN